MRGRTHLRPVRHDDDNVAVTHDNQEESRGNWFESARLPNLIDDMERMMNEVFHRPLLGTGMMPFRGLLQDVGRMTHIMPTVDMFEDAGVIVVKADLPGLTKEDINIKLVDNLLEITGEKKGEETIDRRDYLRLERTFGRFTRTLRLPEGLDTAHVTANFKDGVLDIRIPKRDDKRAIHNVTIE